ncbi:MAG: EamA family transporter [bacterium]|nr:EamA family transporter [bacterium]
MWIGYALLSAVFAAAVAILGKIGLKNVDSTLATTIRAVVMAVFLLGAAAVLQKFSLIKTVGSQTLTFIIFSGVAGALSWLFYFLALKNGPATGVAALDRLSVVFVVILAAMFLGEALTLKSISGLILLVLGALLLVLK